MTALQEMPLRDFVRSNGDVAAALTRSYSARYGFQPSPSEATSWRASLPKLARALDPLADTLRMTVLLEVQMPGSSARADAVLVGSTADGRPCGVVVELKEWPDGEYDTTDGLVNFGPTRVQPHPSTQAQGYADFLSELAPVFSQSDHVLRSCSYLPAMTGRGAVDLRAGQFAIELDGAPMFVGGEEAELRTYIEDTIAGPADEATLRQLRRGGLAISKTLFDEAATAVRDQPAWVLVDEQRAVFDKLVALATADDDDEKHLVLVRGGPGTGKSVVAMQLMGELLRRHIPVVHVTNSSSFTTVTKSLIQIPRDRTWGVGAVKALFRLSHAWIKNPDPFRVAICDEAHRFRERTTFYPNLFSHRPQAEEIHECVDVLVAFIDEKQILRKQEAGTVEYFERCARAVGVEERNIHGPFDLAVQFRSGGSDDFLTVLDAALYDGVARGFRHPDFEVDIVDTVEELEHRLRISIDEGRSARLVAGFCWPWSDPGSDGSLVDDVVLGSWQRPWNRKAGSGSYPPDKHPYTLWARKLPDSLGEVGCIYSVQGFEFDHVGVIWGDDLVWRDGWVAQPENSHDGEMVNRRGVTDPEVALPLLLNSYRVLMSRGMKGCFVYCLDEETRDFLRRALTSGSASTSDEIGSE